MKKIFFGVILLFVMQSCVNPEKSNDNQNPIKVPQETKSKKFDIPDEKHQILDFIAKFIKKDYDNSRDELVAQGKEFDYNISEIKQFGNTFKYTLEIPDVEGYQEYTCVPTMGENMVVVSGDKGMVKLYYDQLKLSKKWDDVRQIKNGESLEFTEILSSKPIQSHIIVTFIEYENESIFTMRRKLIPKL